MLDLYPLWRGKIFKCVELSSRTSKDLNFVLLPSPLRQNLDKNQNLEKQINSFHIQITFQRIPKKFPKNSQNIENIQFPTSNLRGLKPFVATFNDIL